jgi:hypothetical protein
MKTVKLSQGQYKALQALSRKDINTLRRHPGIVSAARQLLRACRRVIRRVESLPEYASRRKRQTAYRHIASVCQKAIEKAGG